MSYDGHSNFAIGAVATPPSPATTGPSLTLNSGQGALMPTPPFNATVWPANAQPTATNAEIVRVTGIAGDVLTITRGPQAGDPGGVNRTIVTGDQIQAGITVKIVADLESAITAEATRATNAEALKAPLASPALTGTPAAPTQTALDNSTRLATTAYADGAVGVEKSRAQAAEALLAPLASPALTGTPTVPTVTPSSDSSTKAASTAFVQSAVSGASILFKRGLWYVDHNNGNDSTGDGSQALPYATFGKAYSSASQGDEIHLAVAAYPECFYIANKQITLIFHGDPGSSSGAGAAHPVAPDDFTDCIVVGPGADGTVIVNPAPRGSSANWVGHGIRVFGSNAVRIVNPYPNNQGFTPTKTKGGVAIAIGHCEHGVIEGPTRISSYSRGVICGVEAVGNLVEGSEPSVCYQDRFTGPYECYRSRVMDAGGITNAASSVSIFNSADLVAGPGFLFTKDPLAAPAAPTPAATGSDGALTAGTYTVAVSYVNAFGETVASSTSTQAVSGAQHLTISSPAALANATGWYAYVSQHDAPGTLYRQQPLGTPTAIGTAVTLTANPTTTGTNPANGTNAYVPEGLWYPSGGNTANALTGVQRAILGYLSGNINNVQTANIKVSCLAPGNQVNNGLLNPGLVKNFVGVTSVTVEPGTGNAETITCTSITDNGDGTFTLGGTVARGQGGTTAVAHNASSAVQDTAKTSAATHAQNTVIIQSNGSGLAAGWGGSNVFLNHKGTNCQTQRPDDVVDEHYSAQIFVNNDFEESGGPASNKARFYSSAGASLHIGTKIAQATVLTDDSSSVYIQPSGNGALVLSSLFNGEVQGVNAANGPTITNNSTAARFAALRATTTGVVPALDLSTLGDQKALYYDLASGLLKWATLLQPPVGASAGDVFYYNGTGYSRAAVGSPGQVLTNVAGVPAFAGGGGGTTRQAMRDQARGYSGAVWDLNADNNVGGGTFTSQQLDGTLIGLLTGDVLTNIIVWVNTAAAGTAPTGVFFALYDLSGNLLASTVDLHANAAWNTAGMYAFAFQSPYTVTTNGGYYLAGLINGTWGTTQLKLGQAFSASGNQRLGSNAFPCVKQTGQATLPGPAALVAGQDNFWYAWS